MVSMDARIEKIRQQTSGYWVERILAEMTYACNLRNTRSIEGDDILADSMNLLEQAFNKEGALTKDVVLHVEESLHPLVQAAKEYRVLCVAHAHIDMNWMWAWQETVAVVVDTVRTMLDLMNEYSQFTFSQSQASVYQILENHAPDMLEEVRQRVREGRWEVTASTWVEPDKNMPNGESLSRHLLYTKQYLSHLLGIDPDSLKIDFEPDTFGHSANVPEILQSAGVQYFYHCRGYEGHFLYRWMSPSGSFVTAYREPLWYNGTIGPELAAYVPEFCQKHGLTTYLKVYGVGDHGGGPTRRDIERLLDMQTWPIYPKIEFGTFHQWFAEVETVAETLPVVEGELNFVFTGCYTSQSRIKQANRVAETTLYETELFNTLSAIHGGFSYSNTTYANAWKNVLFNQFHDIVPGSGVTETREYAMGLFQNTMATANVRRSQAIKSIAAKVDTLELSEEIPEQEIANSTSEGAGVGYGLREFGILQTERGLGKTRIYHVFNALPYHRNEIVEVTIWDWPGDVHRLVAQDARGHRIAHQIVKRGMDNYWGHTYVKLLLEVSVPSTGYATYVIKEDLERTLPLVFPSDQRVENQLEYALENERIRAIFDGTTGALISFYDKQAGLERLDASQGGAVFRFIEEDDSRGMTAWVVGRHMNIQPLVQGVRLKRVDAQPSMMKQVLTMEIPARHSHLQVEVSLDAAEPYLNYQVTCDWREFGEQGHFVPQLGFYAPLAYECQTYRYDIPMGVVNRPAMDMDVPGNHFVAGISRDGSPGVMLMTDSKYGFRATQEGIAVTLIRSSYDPDPTPEIGRHSFGFALAVVSPNSKEMFQLSQRFQHSLQVVSGGRPHRGSLPSASAGVEMVEGFAVLSALKMAEDSASSHTMVLRLFEVEGKPQRVTLRFPVQIESARYVDLTETKSSHKYSADAVSVKGANVSLDLLPYGVVTVAVGVLENSLVKK